jgi:hypothetical protein
MGNRRASISDRMGEFKHCKFCRRALPATIEYFHPNKNGLYGLHSKCKQCRAAYSAEWRARPESARQRMARERAYVLSGKKAARSRAFRANNTQSAKASARRYRQKTREQRRIYAQRWRDANRAKVRAKQRRADAKLQRNPSHVLKKRIKSRLRQLLKGQWLGSTEKILGYTREQLRQHIERQFSEGMTWARLMRGEIHIDHIVPVRSFHFDGVDHPDFKACWTLTNLRPMWAIDNQRKQASVQTLL